MREITKENTKIFKSQKGYELMFLLGDTGNYLHTKMNLSVNDALIVRELIMGQEFTSQDVGLQEDEGYYRMILRIRNINGEEIQFHGRKLNLNDAVFEIDELVQVD